jgi:predicted deacylase
MRRRLPLLPGAGLLAAALLAAALLAAGLAAAPAGAATGGGRPVLLGRTVIGYSVQHRPIVAYHLGNPRKRPEVIIGQLHGDERAGVVLARSIVRGRVPVKGINLWVIPTANPDGYAHHRRQNAHGVDLNRNWPHAWARLSGMYYSGRAPLSEPETRALSKFLRRLRPHYVVSLHQPLRGVDTTDGGRIDPAFRHRLAYRLGLPSKPFTCWSTCHGSLTGWYTARHLGVAITVEFGAHPSRRYLTHKARRAIVTSMGGSFG